MMIRLALVVVLAVATMACMTRINGDPYDCVWEPVGQPAMMLVHCYPVVETITP